MRFIVSLCNKKAAVERERDEKMLYPGVFLLEIDSETDTINPIKVRWWSWGSRGVTGLMPYKEGFLCLLQAKRHRLFWLDKNYKVKKSWRLKRVKDGHSLAVKDDKIYIASTGNDSIVEFIPETGEERIFWKENSMERDSIHMNSMIWMGSHMIISAFGKKAGEQWITARNGFLMNIHTGQKIKDSLFHPHTLLKTEQGVFLCESAKKRVIALNEADILDVERGYVRGLLITEDEIAVGISHARRRSKSTGKLNRLDDELMSSFRNGCGIKIYRRHGKRLRESEFVKFIDLYPFSNEIYDLILI